MNYLRYYLGAAIVIAGIIGFLLGDAWVWLGLATFIPLLMIDVIAKKDLKRYDANIDWLAELPLYLHLFLMVALYAAFRSEEHTSELQSLTNLVCRLLLEKKNQH